MSVQRTMTQLNDLSHAMEKAVEDLNRIAGQVEESTNAAITSLQFQDRIAQTLQHMQQRLGEWQQLQVGVDWLPCLDARDAGRQAQQMAALTEKVHALVAQVRNGREQKLASVSAGGASDDIELF